MEGKRPVYYTDAGLTVVFKAGEPANIYVDWVVSGYRLPTEAEWEKAARGGRTNQRFPWGNTISETQANYKSDTLTYTYDLGPNGYNAIYAVGGGPYTSPVGSFAPNGYGLYDMAGNVCQWCWDRYGASYQYSLSDPTGPDSGSLRVFRGGAWNLDTSTTRCAKRDFDYPYNNLDNMGFRTVLPVGQ
jgi:formylglycine-generating enzyme required for sulfatase activity